MCISTKNYITVQKLVKIFLGRGKLSSSTSVICVLFRYYPGVGDTIGRVFSESVIISRQLWLEEPWQDLIWKIQKKGRQQPTSLLKLKKCHSSALQQLLQICFYNYLQKI